MKTQKKSIFVMSLLCLAACKQITPAQVATLNGDELCDLSYVSNKYDPPSQEAISGGIRTRALNCEPNHRTCISYGHKFGSKAYADCRMKIRQMQEESAQVDQLMQGLQAIKATPETSNIQVQDNTIRPPQLYFPVSGG